MKLLGSVDARSLHRAGSAFGIVRRHPIHDAVRRELLADQRLAGKRGGPIARAGIGGIGADPLRIRAGRGGLRQQADDGLGGRRFDARSARRFAGGIGRRRAERRREAGSDKRGRENGGVQGTASPMKSGDGQGGSRRRSHGGALLREAHAAPSCRIRRLAAARPSRNPRSLPPPNKRSGRGRRSFGRYPLGSGPKAGGGISDSSLPVPRRPPCGVRAQRAKIPANAVEDS